MARKSLFERSREMAAQQSKGTGEMEVAYRIYDIIVGLCKDEVALRVAAVDEDSVQSGSTHVSEGIVFASQSFREG